MTKKSLFAGFLAFLLLPLMAGGSDIPDFERLPYIENMTPSQMHRIMAEAKAAAFDRSRAIEKSLRDISYSHAQTDFDVKFYRIELAVSAPDSTIYGNVGTTAEALVNNLDTVVLDFDVTLTIDSVYLQDGTRLDYLHSGMTVTVALDRAYQSGETFSFTIRYHGTPTSGFYKGFFFGYRSGVPAIYTLSEPYMARSWWPCKDRPDDKADSIDIIITCDTALFCASNGNLTDTLRNGDGTWTFYYAVRYPITTYLFSLSISKFTVWKDWYHYSPTDSMVIINHPYTDQYTASVTGWGITPYALEILSGLFGEYPFINEKYGHANFGWGGGMEHQTVTSMISNWFGYSEPVVVHELAHQWWGDMITCNNWHEIWLNEGFASYSEALYYEVKNGRNYYHSYMDGMDYADTGAIYRYDTTNSNAIFNLIVYDKGAWFLHMLRHIVGDSTFFEILRAYYDSPYKYGDATSARFQEICETVSGMDLDYFFQDWLYGQLRPNYLWSYMNELDPSDGKYWTFFMINQVQASQPQVFRMPIDLRFTFSPGDTSTTVVFHDTRKRIYIFKNDQGPSDIVLDPNKWILRNATKTTWAYNLIPFPLNSGQQYQPFNDSIVARGGTGFHKFTLKSGTLPAGLTLDTLSGIISGIPYDYGTFNFNIRANDQYSSYKDSADYTITVAPVAGLAGDADNNDAVNILDITFLLSYLYKSGAAPPVMALADPNRSCDISVLDITYLISFLYKDGPAPLIGCVP